MKKKILFTGTGLLVVVLLSYFLFFRGTSRKYDFRYDKLTVGDLTVFVTATGTINAVTSVDVGTQVSGIVLKLFADFNSVVKEGQVIAQIDPTFLQQSVKDAAANLDRSKAQYADSKRIVDRTRSLFEKSLESQVNYDAATTTFESNQAALKQAVATLDRAKINLAYATIYAPINGVVIDRKVNVGQTVAASFSSPTLFTIANDLKKMQVQTTVDESDIGRISIGQEVTFTVDAYPDEKFTGTVSQIRLAPVSIQNVVNYTVIVDVNNDQLKLMPGMTANVKVLVASTSDVLKVPNMALRFQPPAELVDSAKIQSMREAMSSKGGRDNDTSHANLTAEGTPESQGGSPPSSDGRRGQFKALRDSIMKAHQGQLSRDELMAEMGKVMGGKPTKPAPAPPPKPPANRTAGGTKFGITQTFPEYQKSAYVPSHLSGRARIWILNASGKLEPVFVRTGVTDGRYTEITSADLKAGDQIIIGASSTSDAATPGNNPLTGPGGRPGGGGMR